MISGFYCGIFDNGVSPGPTGGPVVNITLANNQFNNIGAGGNICGLLGSSTTYGLDTGLYSPLQGSAVISSPSVMNLFASSLFATYPKPLSITAQYLNVLGAEIRIHASVNWFNTTSTPAGFYSFVGASLNGSSGTTAFTSTAVHCVGPTTTFNCASDVTIVGKVIVAGSSGTIQFTGHVDNLFAGSAIFPAPQTEVAIMQPYNVSIDLTTTNYIELALFTGSGGTGYSTSLSNITYEFYFPASVL